MPVEWAAGEQVGMAEGCPRIRRREPLRPACPIRRLLYSSCLRLDQCHLPQEGHLEPGDSLAMVVQVQKIPDASGLLIFFLPQRNFPIWSYPFCMFFLLSPHPQTQLTHAKARGQEINMPKKKKNHWKNKKEQNSEPSQCGSLGGAFH